MDLDVIIFQPNVLPVTHAEISGYSYIVIPDVLETSRWL